MTEVREMLIPYTEVTVLSVACPQCGAEITVNMANSKQQRPTEAEGRLVQCGICRTDFDSALSLALVAFKRWLNDAERSRLSLTFRVRVSAGV